VQTLLGNVSTAQDYASYLQNTAAINALIAAEPESAFSAGWTITFARSIELGLNRRAATDWVGGFNAWMDELADGKIDGQTLSPSQFSAFLDPFTNERSWGVVDGEGNYLGSVGDSIESGAKDSLTGTAGNDVIIVGTTASGLGQFTATGGFILNGEAQASAGADFTAISGTLTFNAGERSRSFTVGVTSDGIAESAEAFVARLSNATGSITLLDTEASLTITDDAVAQLRVSDAITTEGQVAIFRLTLSKAHTSAVTLALGLSGRTASGDGVDYGIAGQPGIEVSTNNGVSWAAATSATFAAGATSILARIATVADNSGVGTATLNKENNERFTLSAIVSAGTIANDSASGTGIIVDASDPGTYAIIDDATFHEASGTRTVTVSLSRAATAPGSLTWTTSDRSGYQIDVAAVINGEALKCHKSMITYTTQSLCAANDDVSFSAWGAAA
jgi:Calx-beta domain